ncbi:hypothetical protein POTOM_061415 [Populus tomentosa]|uniref:Uncharacterized protein n=1 Tax=Populus tomentosa TaxID=118781 RepID=A0A8X8BZR1_POPTO|nr:hypothetical protein POTOM_061415 [Populus tomentosa]
MWFSMICLNTRNRDLVLLSLASNVIAHGGFYNTTIGLGNDTVYGLGLCISDLSAESCSICVNSAIQALIAACPNQKEAISWEGDPVPCFVRYANHYLLGSLELSPTDSGYNTGILETNTKEFGQIWTSLMMETVRRPSMGSSRLKYIAFGTVNLTSFINIYVLMQCTPDISPSNCSYCLQESVAYFKGKGYTASRIIIFTVVPTAIFLALVILTLTVFRFRKQNFLFFFRWIYLQGVLADGKAIAVKKLSSISGQGEVEFKNEVQIIAKLEHKNLVRFLGCCMEGTEKLLIYEFQPNSSLDQFIIDPKKRLLLTLEMRFMIIEDIARGILLPASRFSASGYTS